MIWYTRVFKISFVHFSLHIFRWYRDFIISVNPIFWVYLFYLSRPIQFSELTKEEVILSVWMLNNCLGHRIPLLIATGHRFYYNKPVWFAEQHKSPTSHMPFWLVHYCQLLHCQFLLIAIYSLDPEHVLSGVLNELRVLVSGWNCFCCWWSKSLFLIFRLIQHISTLKFWIFNTHTTCPALTKFKNCLPTYFFSTVSSLPSKFEISCETDHVSQKRKSSIFRISSYFCP